MRAPVERFAAPAVFAVDRFAAAGLRAVAPEAEREALAREALAHLPRVRVISFLGLLVDLACEQGISFVVRGVRDGDDFHDELLLHQVGESQKLGIETVLLPGRRDLNHVSSGAAKALQREQGLIHDFVPLAAKRALEERLSGQSIIGVTGEIGVGKSHLCRRLVDLGHGQGLEIHHIELDRIAHDTLHIGTERKTMFELARRRLPTVQPATRAAASVDLPRDVSLDVSRWLEIEAELTASRALR